MNGEPKKYKKERTFFNFPLAFFLCMGAGAVTLGAAWALHSFTELDTSSVLVFGTVIYAFLATVIVVSLAIRGRITSRHEVILHRFDRMLDNMVFPYIITNSDGLIIKHNNAAERLFVRKLPGFLEPVSLSFPFITPELIKESAEQRKEISYNVTENGAEVTHYLIFESTVTVIGDETKSGDPSKGRYYLTTIIDITEEKNRQLAAARKLEDETIAVGRIEIDDLKAFSDASGISEKTASDKVRELLTDWAIRSKGIITEPETRKFTVLMPLSSLGQEIRERFPILDTVREALSTKEEELTVSMGFSASGESLSERMRNAELAFEQRKSGNKAVVNTAGEMTFYGKDRRRQISRGSSEYRRIGNTLRRLITESGNVLIMGHSRPDYDSIGSAIGVSRLAADVGRDWHIVIRNQYDENFAILTEELRETEEYEGRFICEEEALELVRSDTLLIITDVNSAKNMESVALYTTVRETTGGKIVILDHHEKSEATAGCDFAYIDTSCSSTSEIVAGVLELSLHKKRLVSEEATILLTGIMLDTKNFTQYATQKTYAAAEYLSFSSGRADRANRFFDADYETFNAEYNIGSSLKLCYDGRVAICSGNGLPDEAKTRIVIGRVADRLIAMKNVFASVAIAEYDGRCNASFRSNNDKVNCAALAGSLGGGNFNNAGARAVGLSLAEFKAKINENIEEYFKDNFGAYAEDDING